MFQERTLQDGGSNAPQNKMQQPSQICGSERLRNGQPTMPVWNTSSPAMLFAAPKLYPECRDPSCNSSSIAVSSMLSEISGVDLLCTSPFA
ncbi:MAG: hypothetical protein L6R42_010525 [Xanthoria sp. 1 TBL-2021]|nr:MAG: hypothetical protein L6R42_010525 [Xanthoria sp. 1 TBL-2021]